ncbi:MAG: hypothetical protein HQK51_17150 [Oligoflexia bacterium]|nr:hypothetical protein [Oligoflexia bacterium]
MKKIFNRAIYLTILINISCLLNISWAQTQTAQTSQEGPVYNFQFFNTPTPIGTPSNPTTPSAPSTSTTTPATIVNNTPTSPQVAPQTTNNQQQQLISEKKRNHWIPSVGYFIINRLDNSLETKKDNPEYRFSGYDFSLKIPLFSTFSLVPKLMISKKNDYQTEEYHTNSSNMNGVGIDFRYDYFSGNYLGTGIGLSTLAFKKNTALINNYYYDTSATYETYTGYAVGLFFAPNLTYDPINLEVLGQIGYQTERTSYTGQYSRQNRSRATIYTLFMLNIGITI